MGATTESDGDPEDGRLPERQRGTRELARQSLISGVAIIVPLLVTLVVIGLVVNFVSSTLDPVVSVVQGVTPNQDLAAILIELITVLVLLVVVFLVGFVAETGRTRGRLGESFDAVMASIPGLGSVYSSFDEMSELLLDSDTDSFQEVKLVEYPREGSYTVAFKTAETPTLIEEGAGHPDMVTLFMPMAPNPVMGGFVIHVSRDRVTDVDMTVEQGIRSIVTSGVAIGEEGPRVRGLSATELGELAGTDAVAGRAAPGTGPAATPDERAADRRESYDRNVSPEHSATPRKIIERSREEGTVGREVDRDRPATAAGEGVIGDETEREPAERAGRSREATESTGDDPPAELAGRDGNGDGPPVDGTDAPAAHEWPSSDADGAGRTAADDAGNGTSPTADASEEDP
jgi:uncharacterized membrane protein